MFDRLDDTIVAISSPAGASVRGIIRLSGPDAFVLAATVFRPEQGPGLTEAPGHRRITGRVRIADSASVPAEAYAFRAPASYTRQDIIELHTIGSPPVLAMVLEQLTGQGARPAEPGEFTARAFFSGAMDLTRVEGVAAIIHARNDSQLRASEALLHGRLSKRSTALRDQLADLLALIEAQIDFVEEPIDFVSPDQVLATIARVAGELDSLIRNSPSVERLEVLPQVMLVGPPNTGKSTLFNRLTGIDRAIQSATAGTTRDVLRAPASVPGGEVTLLDSAGLGTPGEGPAGGQPLDIGKLGEAATRRFAPSADFFLLVLDITNATEDALQALRSVLPETPTLVIVNKIDQVPPEQLTTLMAGIGTGVDVIPTSALTGSGIEPLRAEVGKTLFSTVQHHGSDMLALSNRQRGALRDAHEALRRARGICDESPRLTDHPELLAIEIREAVSALSLLVGQVATEELLGRIFSRFCIGK